MVVCISGSRSLSDNGKRRERWADPNLFRDGVRLVRQAILESGWDVTAILSGAAAGIDAAAIDWARQMQVPCRLFPADWQQYGRRAGPIRNQEMTKYEDALIAIWDGVSRGTAHKILCSRGANHPIHILRIT